MRGLSSIELADEHGLLHYQGEHTTKLVALGLLLLIPVAAALALAYDLTALASLLLLASFVGLPTLALFDARQAGDQRGHAVGAMPASAPELPEAASSEHEEQRGPRPEVVYRGLADASARVVRAQLSGAECLCFRLDIRAGERAKLVARYTCDNEFIVSCADGTQVLVAGVVELTARGYLTIRESERSAFKINDTDLLPALFASGGWACELPLMVGDEVQVRGVVSGERRHLPFGNSYRQSATIEVLRGTPGSPVIVSRMNADVMESA